MSTVSKPRAPRQHAFAFAVAIDQTPYLVSALDCDPSIGKKAWRFEKQTEDGEVYDLCLNQHGLECQCKGFLRWGRCKHIETLHVASRIFGLADVAQVVSASKAPVTARSLGDMARNQPEEYARLAGTEEPADAWIDAPVSIPWTDADVDGFAQANGQP